MDPPRLTVFSTPLIATWTLDETHRILFDAGDGVTALLDQSVHGRVGLLNFALYDLVRFGVAYKGKHAPLRDITAGDNWFYQGKKGYDLGSGVGVPDVANLIDALRP